MSHSRKLLPGQRSCGVVDEMVRQLSMVGDTQGTQRGDRIFYTIHSCRAYFRAFRSVHQPGATPPDNRTNLAVWYPHGV